jgi:hypothetical protein
MLDSITREEDESIVGYDEEIPLNFPTSVLSREHLDLEPEQDASGLRSACQDKQYLKTEPYGVW